MNRVELERIRRENLNKLDTAYRPKVNALEVDIGNSFVHELVKFYCVWLLRNGVPANMLPKLNMKEIDWRYFGAAELYSKFKHEWKRPQVVTEARFKKSIKINPDDLMVENLERLHKSKQRRADIFILDTGEIIEIETDNKVKKEGENVITVRI